jgi:hypothetical protein
MLRQSPSVGAAESGAVGDDLSAIDARLAAIIAAWPKLPEETRLAVLALVDGAANAPRTA